jgi:hypothetical protein
LHSLNKKQLWIALTKYKVLLQCHQIKQS